MDVLRLLHLLAMAFFVGGQLFLAAAVVPAFRGGADRERVRLIARRFLAGSLVAIAVLAATGAALAGRFDQWGSGLLQVKLALVVAVLGLVAWHMRRPGSHALEGLVFVVSVAIVALGVALAH